MRTKKNQDGIRMFYMTESEFWEMDAGYEGCCIHCGDTRDSCEPDARKYNCYDCETRNVYGMSELLAMGRIEFVEEPRDEEQDWAEFLKQW